MTDDRIPEDRLRALLSEAATEARPARAWGDFVVNARRSLRFHRAIAIGAAASVLVLGVLVGRELTGLGADNAGGLTGPAGQPGIVENTTAAPEETADPSPSANGACEYPDERPTYLPWLEEGEEVGEPMQHEAEPGDEGSDFASLLWPRDESDPDSDYVSLFAQTGEGGEPHGEEVDAEIDGEKGRFEIAPGDGDATITWWFGSGRCNVVVLTLRTAEWDDAKLEEEITRVARSLSDGE